MTTPKGIHAEICTGRPASNSVAQEDTAKQENNNTNIKSQDEANMKHFGESSICTADGENDSLCYKMEKLCVQEHSDSTSKAITCKKVQPSNIFLVPCEKNELCSKPDMSIQETIVTLPGTSTSQAISETDNDHKNEMVAGGQVVDVVETNPDAVGKGKNGQRIDTEELITVKTVSNNPLGYLRDSTSTKSSSSTVNKKKERRNEKKKLEKDEKRRKRELEFLKNLVPKEHRVRIVDRSTFQKILKDSDSSQNESHSLGLSFDEFPALNLPKNEDKFSQKINQHFSIGQGSKTARVFGRPLNNVKQHKSVSESHSAAAHETVNRYEMPRMFDRTLNHVKQCKRVSEFHSSDAHETIDRTEIPREFDRTFNHVKQHLSESNSVASHETVNKNEMEFDVSSKTGINGGMRSTGKPPKKRDPIKIDILHCIKMVKTKDTTTDSKRSSSSLEKGSKLKENFLISGNELDSSNPQRSKGKKREQPRRKRPSKLKLVILQERELKKQLEELQTQKSSQENKKEIEGPVCTNSITATDPKLSQINYEGSIQDSKDKCQFHSPKEFTPIPCESQSQIDQNGKQNILQRDVSVSTEEQSTNAVLSLKAIKKEDSEVDSEKHCLLIASCDDEEKIAPLSNVENDCIHSLQNKQCHSSMITDIFAVPNTQSVSYQEKQEKPSTYTVSDTLPKHNEEIIGLHSKKFRPYCDNIITDEINSSVRSLLQDIVKFHDRHYERDPVKANARRRHVTGLREVLKYLNLKRLKLIIIAPDLDLIESSGGICDIVEQMKEGAKSQEIPLVFALHRKILGKITFKKVPVSCVGVISYDGTEKNFHALMKALPEAKKQYQEALINAVQKPECNSEMDVNNQVIASILSKLMKENTSIHTEHTKEEY